MADRAEKAREVILEIIRQSPGDSITGRVRLFKAFYFAHLFHLRKTSHYLSTWPIVNMTFGPGIDDFPQLMSSLVEQRRVAVTSKPTGPFQAHVYTAQRCLTETSLSPDEIDSIREAVDYIKDKDGSQLSEITHEHSLSWRESASGAELCLALDLMEEDELDALRERQGKIGDIVASVFGPES